MRAAIVVERGASLLNASQDDPLGPWREAGGKLRFDALVLNWGPLETTGAGEGSLDAQRRLQGRLVLPIEHPAVGALAARALCRGSAAHPAAQRHSASL